jgi:tetratricopeptide (TPR) repeat protein
LLVGAAHELSARALVHLGRFDEAVSRFAEVNKVALQAVASPLNCARIMRRKGDLPATVKWLDAAEAKTAGHANVLLERGMTYLQMKEPAKALPLLEKASRSEPWNVHAKPLLAEAYVALGRKAEAKAALASVAGELGSDPAVARRLGFLQLQDKDFRKAAASLERALAVSPRDPGGWKALGTARLKAKDYAAAAEAFANSTTLEPGDAKAWYRLGVLRSKLGDHTRAAEALERVVGLQAKSGKMLHRLGMTYLAAKDKGGVRRTLERLARAPHPRAPRLRRSRPRQGPEEEGPCESALPPLSSPPWPCGPSPRSPV